MSIKYYNLAKDETPPEEFCAIKDVGGEPREYTFYVLDAENAKLCEQLEYERQTARSRLERIDQLKDENAKLRVERDEWHRVAESKQDIIDHMRDTNSENAKLRELCVDYDKTLDIAIRGYVGIDKPLLIGANQTALRSRMYGLGIEVE